MAKGGAGVGYEAINAKIRAMSGKLMTYDDYQALASCANVPDFWRKLQDNPSYAAVLTNPRGDAPRRESIESAIILALVNDFEKIYVFIGEHGQREYLDAFFRRYEIDMLKQMLCAVFDERAGSVDEPRVSAFLERKLRIDVRALLASRTVSAFIEGLRGTRFYGVLADHYEEGKTTLFELEMRLDVFYYTWLWQSIKHLDKRNRQVMRSLIGMEIDLRNITCIYRLRSFYRVQPGLIYSYLAPARFRISREMVSRLADASGKDELLAAVNATPYFNGYSGAEAIEAPAHAALDKAHRRRRVDNPDSLATAAAYLHFKEREIRRVVTLVECVRYQLGAEEAMRIVMS